MSEVPLYDWLKSILMVLEAPASFPHIMDYLMVLENYLPNKILNSLSTITDLTNKLTIL